MAQVLVRRGMAYPQAARAFLAADEQHPPQAFAGIQDAVAVIVGHLRGGTRITVHGDYDVDGICSTAVLVRSLRALGGDVDSYLPDRAGDGYGLNPATVRRLAARGTRLLLTADCGVGSVEEVARRRSWGWRWCHRPPHAARRRACCRARRSCTPRCAAIRARTCARRRSRTSWRTRSVFEARGWDATPRAGWRPARLDLVALATIADVVDADRREPHARAQRAAGARRHRQARPARADGGRGR